MYYSGKSHGFWSLVPLSLGLGDLVNPFNLYD